jgi:hypothetical protein
MECVVRGQPQEVLWVLLVLLRKVAVVEPSQMASGREVVEGEIGRFRASGQQGQWRCRGNSVSLTPTSGVAHLSHSFVQDIPPAIPLPMRHPPRAEWAGHVNFEAFSYSTMKETIKRGGFLVIATHR